METPRFVTSSLIEPLGKITVDYQGVRWDILREPFKESELEWRVQSGGVTKSGKPWVRVLCYVQARAIQNRLDSVIGPENWKVRYRYVSDADRLSGVLCGLSIRIVGTRTTEKLGEHWSSEWVTKWDGAELTDIEPFKGGISSAIKRAAVLWGIGRYLYDIDTNFGNIVDPLTKGSTRSKIKYLTNEGQREMEVNWLPPKLPDWALPKKN